MQLTLEDLKNRPLNKDMYDSMYETWELGDKHNISVYRHNIRNGNQRDIESECYDMTHDGNEPMEIEEMLDHARCFYEDNIFTDEEWVNIFIPAINKQIEENDSFERWYPGYVIKNKKTGKLAILGGDHAYWYGGTNFTDLDIYEINGNGDITTSWAWGCYSEWEVVDKKHIIKNIKKLAEYRTKHRYC